MLAQSSLISDLKRINALLKTCTDTAQEINEHNLHLRSPEQFAKTEDVSKTEGLSENDFGEYFSHVEPPAVEDRSTSTIGSSEYLKENLEKQALQESVTEKPDETKIEEFSCITSSSEQTICDQGLLCSEKTKLDTPKSILKRKKNLTDRPSAPTRKFAQFLREKNSVTVGGDTCTTPEKTRQTKRVKFDLLHSDDKPHDDSEVSVVEDHLNHKSTQGTSPASPTMERTDRVPGQGVDGWSRSDRGGHQQHQKCPDEGSGSDASCRNKVTRCVGGGQSAVDNWTSVGRENLAREQDGLKMDSVGETSDDVCVMNVDAIKNSVLDDANHVRLSHTNEEKRTDCVERNATFKSDEDFTSGNLLEESVEKKKKSDEGLNSHETFVTNVATEEASRLHIRRTSESAVEHKSPNMETPIHFANIVEIIHRDAVKTTYEKDDDSKIPDLVFSENSESLTVINAPDASTGAKVAQKDPSLAMQNSSPICDNPRIISNLNDYETQTSSSVHNDPDNEDADSEGDDDGTMIIHDVENTHEDVRPEIFVSSPESQHTANRECKLSNKSLLPTSNSSSSSSENSTTPEDEDDKAEQTSINPKNEGKLNPLQTLDSSRLRTERGVYSRMFLRQFKSNIYKKKQTLAGSRSEQNTQNLGEDAKDPNLHQPSSPKKEASYLHSSSVGLPCPKPQADYAQTDSHYTNADLMMKIDRISSLLDQFISSNTSTKTYSGSSNHQHWISDRDSVSYDRYSNVKTVRFMGRRTCRNAVINGITFLIALFLYMLSVFALLRISFFKLNVSLQHKGVVPVFFQKNHADLKQRYSSTTHIEVANVHVTTRAKTPTTPRAKTPTTPRHNG
ncbi:hypothetical protein FHG87_016165 [Trinorchestia longiramus]|nr:hypothetical protein FHG87_016165 [Trinorchestia longiramus]